MKKMQEKLCGGLQISAELQKIIIAVWLPRGPPRRNAQKTSNNIKKHQKTSKNHFIQFCQMPNMENNRERLQNPLE